MYNAIESTQMVFMTKQDFETLLQEQVQAMVEAKTVVVPFDISLKGETIKPLSVNGVKYLSRTDTSKLLNKSFPALWRWNNSGKLTNIKIGQNVYYRYDDIVKLLEGTNSKERRFDMCTILPDDGQFSFFKRPISNIMPYHAIGLTDVYRYVKGNYAKSRTEKLRSITDPKDRKLYKANNFDYCTFSGLFGKRGEKDLLTPSDLLCIDFDHVTDIPRLKKQLIEHEYFDTELLFVSPSGDGIKWIIRQWSQGYSHQDLFRAVANCLRETGVPPVDMSGSDIARACFLPHDPNVYINPKYAEYAAENFFRQRMGECPF